MQSKWRTNDAATKQVKTLLEQAGLPLELQVAEVCKQFREKHNRPKIVDVSSDRVVYSASLLEDNYREIDQRVQIYEEFEIGKLTGIQLMFHMPIECKNRQNLECFSFPLQTQQAFLGFPIMSEMAGSGLFRSLNSSYLVLKEIMPASPVLLEIEDGATPQRLHKENLVYNAAGSLYDFIMFDLRDYEPATEDSSRPSDEEHTLVREFNQYLEEKSYAWWSVLRDRINKIDSQKFDSYNQSRFSGHRIYTPVSVHLPIVCINAPIYKVDWSTSSEIGSFEEIDYCLTSIRKRGWPGRTRFLVSMRTSEAPVVVTNPSGLPKVLELGFHWYEEIRYFLKQGTSEMERRWPLESAFFQRVLHQYAVSNEVKSYRSDLDVAQWL